MKGSKKLKINIDLSSKSNDSTTDDITYEYHWGRIFGAFLVISIVIGLLIGGASYYLEKDNTEHVVEEQAVLSKSIETENQAAANQKTKSVEKNTALTEPRKNNVDEINSVTTPTVENIAKIAPENIENIENKNAVKKALTEITAVNSTIKNVEPKPLFTQLKAEIFSDKIKRFVIASSVNKNEPVGSIHNITFDRSNLATVYAFSDVNHLAGTTLYYIWSLDGKDVAKVKVNVGADRWRSYSSKYIQSNMHGKWKIELENSKGEKLASSQFSY